MHSKARKILKRLIINGKSNRILEDVTEPNRSKSSKSASGKINKAESLHKQMKSLSGKIATLSGKIKQTIVILVME